MTEILDKTIEELDFSFEIPCEINPVFYRMPGFCKGENIADVKIVYDCPCHRVKFICHQCLAAHLQYRKAEQFSHCPTCGPQMGYPGYTYTSIK